MFPGLRTAFPHPCGAEQKKHTSPFDLINSRIAICLSKFKSKFYYLSDCFLVPPAPHWEHECIFHLGDLLFTLEEMESFPDGLCSHINLEAFLKLYLADFVIAFSFLYMFSPSFFKQKVMLVEGCVPQ